MSTLVSIYYKITLFFLIMYAVAIYIGIKKNFFLVVFGIINMIKKIAHN